MTTLLDVELGVLGPLQVRQHGASVSIPGAKPRAVLTMLGLHGGSIVSSDTLVELLWGKEPPRTAAKALQTHISLLRRTLGDGFVLTEGAGWSLSGSEVDASGYKSAARRGREAAAAGDTSQALARFDEALALWRGVPELPDSQRGASERTRWTEGHAALVEDRADALLATGRAAEVIGELEAAVADAPLRERRWGQLMLALYRAGRQGEALGAYQRVRALLADELGVDPGPELRRLEAAIVAQDGGLEVPVAQHLPAATRTVTFLLTDIEGSTAAWESDAGAMAVALARHDEIAEQVVTARGGRLIKTRGEGDATFSVFDRPSGAAAAAIELQDAIGHEPWPLAEPLRIRVALHTGEVEFRDGDYFGRAVNRAARLRSLAAGGQILCSGASAELVVDTLPDDVVLADLGMRQLRNLARPEHVFELRWQRDDDLPVAPADVSIQRPGLPALLAGPGPFVGRGSELEHLFAAWQTALAGVTNAVLIAGEPGVGKTRLAGEWSRRAYDEGALVIYGRCDEDLGAPYQPFAEALRALVPCVDAGALRGLRGVEALLALVPGLADVLPDLAAPTRADPDTERYALFDAVVALLRVASPSTPVVLILDDLHWATKPTLLLLRHLLRFGEQARVQIVGTYRSTDLDRSHPLAAMLADLHRDGSANRVQLSGLDESDVTAYVAEAGYDDEELARALSSVTGGNPFFLIEALRHVDESGGAWDPSTLPQGVREAVSRRLSRLPSETNKALAAAAVVGSRFALDLVEQVLDTDLIDAFDEAAKAGIVIEEAGGHYRFNHAIVRQSLLAELASVRRMRLHQRIATTLESRPGGDDELLAELAYHYFECAWAGNAVKAVEYCRRAADQAMTRLAYEGAADHYDRALHALEEIDDLPDRADQTAELLIARCEALLAAGDVTSAAGAVSQLQATTVDSARLAAWATCFDGQLSMLIHPERLDQVEVALAAAADELAGLADAAGEAKAHTVRATCLARLGRIGDCESALDDALTAARRSREHRRVNAVLAGAPLAALWGPNPVPRAGGRCLDVVRLLRITTESPAVEATSTRCQAVLEAFRGRAAAARRMIESARRTVTKLGLRHALLEVEQFAGIVELIVDNPTAADPHLRLAYKGFRRMGLDADTAETAALLGRTCLVLGRYDEAGELCTESERLAGHALKPSIAWRTLRAQLLSHAGDHDGARHVAEAAVSLAERTDLLVDHGDACLSLATVLSAAAEHAHARTAAQRAVELYERKAAVALAERPLRILGHTAGAAVVEPPETSEAAPRNACAAALDRAIGALNRQAWGEVARLFPSDVKVESRRRLVRFTPDELAAGDWTQKLIGLSREAGGISYRHRVLAVRGEHLALMRLAVATTDTSPDAPQEEMLHVAAIDRVGRFTHVVWFDVEDIEDAYAELDAAYALSEESGRPRLDTPATRVSQHIASSFVAGEWDCVAETLAANIVQDDRRKVIGAGVRQGRDTVMGEISVVAKAGVTSMTSESVAVRGTRLALCRIRSTFRDDDPGAFGIDVLDVIEIDEHERVAARIVFDINDFDAAIAELNARYLAGEAAPHADTWSVIADVYVAHNRRELAPTTPDAVSIDHRRVAAFAPGEGIEYIRAGWELDQRINIYVETVHRLSELGTVFTWAGTGISNDGFAAEWRGLNLLTVDGAMISRSEIFDEADLDAAITRFDELSRPLRQLQNAATRVYDRLRVAFAVRDWDATAEALADNVIDDDRRRTINAGTRHGREIELGNVEAVAQIGGAEIASSVIATRGDRLALGQTSILMQGDRSGPFHIEFLSVIESSADDRLTAHIAFDTNEFDAALAELDARYLAGEAAAHADAWSVVMRCYASLNGRELPPTTPNWANVDHRRGTAFGPGEMTAYIGAAWDLESDVGMYIEAVHRLSDLGVVITRVGRGTSQDGFDAEWRAVDIATVDGDLISRCELFDEGDLDAAIARFDELSRTVSQSRSRAGLYNAASRVSARFAVALTTRDWDGLSEILAGDIHTDDRRRVVSAGPRHGRAAVFADVQAIADLGTTDIGSAVVAIRGERLALSHLHFSGRDPRTDSAFDGESLILVELDAENRMTTNIAFDAHHIDSAITELDARYLADEAAPYADTWRVVAGTYAAIGRREMPQFAPDLATVDHRRVATFGPGELIAYIQAGFELDQNVTAHVEVVHRLTDRGALTTYTARGTSPDGFAAEWREIAISMVHRGLVTRCELFDESELDAALARFDELCRPPGRLENAASRVAERFLERFAARDWDALADTFAADCCSDDRRRVVNAGVRQGRAAALQALRATAEVGLLTTATTEVVAIRGNRLILSRLYAAGVDNDVPHLDVLQVAESDADNRFTAAVLFDVEAADDAYAELDARYLAGEAAPHAHTWSAITRVHDAFNRSELPPVDWINIDHRRGSPFTPDELTAAVRTFRDLTPVVTIRVEAVHRLGERGAVITQCSRGSSPEGLDVEWRMLQVVTVEGDRVTRCELYDETDLDAALARFDELQAPHPDNAASRIAERVRVCVAQRNWAAMKDLLAEDISTEDHRRVIDAPSSDVGVADMPLTVIATRGDRLALSRTTGVLHIVELNGDNIIAALGAFDVDDLNAALADLDARYLAGEAAAHARTWTVVAEAYAALNRHEVPATTPDCPEIDHRSLAVIGPGDLKSYIRATWELGIDTSIYIEAVHRLTDFGAVINHVGKGTSPDGFDAEWRMTELFTVDGDLINRCEMFDDANLDAALARFDELSVLPPDPR